MIFLEKMNCKYIQHNFFHNRCCFGIEIKIMIILFFLDSGCTSALLPRVLASGSLVCVWPDHPRVLHLRLVCPPTRCHCL